MLAVYKKELKTYFTSMVGVVFIGLFLLLFGIFFMLINLLNQYSDFSTTLNSFMMWFILLVPILTMRIVAEENRQKTDQLLYTSPVSIEKIVIGKYLALVTLFAIGVAVISIYPIILSGFNTDTGQVDFAIAYGGILGFFLVGASYLAIGLFISSLMESQVIAAVVSYFVMIFTFWMTSLAEIIPSDHLIVFIICLIVGVLVCLLLEQMIHNIWVTSFLAIVIEGAMVVLYFVKPEAYDGLIAKVVGSLSVVERFTNFSLGIFDISAIIYYLSVCFLFVFVTIQRIKKKRWS